MEPMLVTAIVWRNVCHSVYYVIRLDVDEFLYVQHYEHDHNR